MPTRLTVTDRPLPEVSTELPLVSATAEPSMLRISLAPSVTLLTVSVIEVKVWPASIVEAVTTSEDVGRRAALGKGRVDRRGGQRRLVVDRGDVHVTALTVDVPPSPSLTVKLTVRSPLSGVVVLVFW